MSKSLKVVYENGVFKPLQKINLKEHQKLELVIKKVIKDKTPPKQQSPIRLIGLFESDVIDLGVNHDTYLYNHSK
ncbi:MAG: antitoxin family protein [bacterium]